MKLKIKAMKGVLILCLLLALSMGLASASYPDSGAKKTTTSENKYASSLATSATTQPHTPLTSTELTAIATWGGSYVSQAGTSSQDEFIYVNFSVPEVAEVYWVHVYTYSMANADTRQLGLYNATSPTGGGWTTVVSDSGVGYWSDMGYTISSQADKDKYLKIDENGKLTFSVAIWTNGGTISTLDVDVIEFEIFYRKRPYPEPFYYFTASNFTTNNPSVFAYSPTYDGIQRYWASFLSGTQWAELTQTIVFDMNYTVNISLRSGDSYYYSWAYWELYVDGQNLGGTGTYYNVFFEKGVPHTITIRGVVTGANSAGNDVAILDYEALSPLPDSGAKQTTTGENLYANTLAVSQTTQPHTALNSTELKALAGRKDKKKVNMAGSTTADEFVYANFSEKGVPVLIYATVKARVYTTADTIQLGLYNATSPAGGGWTKVASTSLVNQWVDLEYTVSSQAEKDKYFKLENGNLTSQIAIWTNGDSASILSVDSIQQAAKTGWMLSWSNTRTDDGSLDIGTYDGERITFSISATVPIAFWNWTRNGVDIGNNADSYTTSFVPENYTITVNATGTDGTKSFNTVVWNVETKPTPDIFIKEQGFETVNNWTCEIYQNDNPDYVKYSCGQSTAWATEKSTSYKMWTTDDGWSWGNDYALVKQQVNISPATRLHFDFRLWGVVAGTAHESRLTVMVDDNEIASWYASQPPLEMEDVYVDLSAYVGNNRWIKFKYEYWTDVYVGFIGLGVYIDDIVLAPGIYSWSNNLTNDNSTTLTDVDRRVLTQGDTIRFNVTATQPIQTWKWYKDDILQDNNYDNFTFPVQDFLVHTIRVSGTNKFNGVTNEISWTIIPAMYHPPFIKYKSFAETGWFWYDINIDGIRIADPIVGSESAEYYTYGNTSNSTAHFGSTQEYAITIYRTTLDWWWDCGYPGDGSKTKINTQLFIDNFTTPKWIWGPVITGDVEPSIARDSTNPAGGTVIVRYNFTEGTHNLKVLARIWRWDDPYGFGQCYPNNNPGDRADITDITLIHLTDGKKGQAISENLYATSLPGASLGTPTSLTQTELYRLKSIDSAIVTQAGSTSNDAYIIANLSLTGVDTIYDINATTNTMISASDTTQIGLYNITWNNWTKVTGTATVGSYMNLSYNFGDQDRVIYINPINSNDKKISLAFWSNGGSTSTINADMMRFDAHYIAGFRPSGYVKDPTGIPLEGATVKLNNRSWQSTVYTNNLGYYDFGVIADGWYNYNIFNPLETVFGRVKIRQGFPYQNETLPYYVSDQCTTICYVAKNGSDSNTGLSWSSAFYNISTGVNTTQPYGLLHIGYGNYSNQSAINGSKPLDYWCDSSGYQENPAQPWCDMPLVAS